MTCDVEITDSGGCLPYLLNGRHIKTDLPGLSREVVKGEENSGRSGSRDYSSGTGGMSETGIGRREELDLTSFSLSGGGSKCVMT